MSAAPSQTALPLPDPNGSPARVRQASGRRSSVPSAASLAGTLRTLSTGHSALDACLPGGGWPLGALTELLPDRAGIGELSLLVPALARLAREPRWIVWVAPPWLPYAPALAAAGVDPRRILLVHPRDGADRLWAAARALASGTASAVLAWLPAAIRLAELRRLQLAAERGGTWGVLFRPPEVAPHPSPAVLRIALAAESSGELRLRVLRRRGGWPTELVLPRPGA